MRGLSCWYQKRLYLVVVKDTPPSGSDDVSSIDHLLLIVFQSPSDRRHLWYSPTSIRPPHKYLRPPPPNTQTTAQTIHPKATAHIS